MENTRSNSYNQELLSLYRDKWGKDNCFNLSTIGDGSIFDYSDPNSTNELVHILSIATHPNFLFNEFNSTHYQWCGPMIMIVDYFARFSKTRFSISNNFNQVNN